MAKIIPSVNNFASFYPDIAAEWHPAKNKSNQAPVLTSQKPTKTLMVTGLKALDQLAEK
jgi:hypothetical protein